MTIPTSTGNAELVYEGNGTTTIFDIPFAFASAAEIAVYLNGVAATGVSIFGAGDPFGGTAVFATAPTGGDVIRIRRLQTVHVSDNDTTAHPLADKLVAGFGIQITEQNDGGDETLEIAVTGGVVPAGLVSPFAGVSAPAGWLLCDGAAVSRDTYAALFAVTGTTYGVGNGTTTFNLPDLRGRVAAGKDNMGGTAANRLTAASAAGLNGSTLGAAGGNQQHTLTDSELPTTALISANPIWGIGNELPPEYSYAGGQPHNNVQPTLVLNYIIKA